MEKPSLFFRFGFFIPLQKIPLFYAPCTRVQERRKSFFGVCLIKAALGKVVSNIQVYRQDSIHGIHKALLLMEGITDQTKFLAVKKELSEILGSIVQLLSEAYARMNTLGMLQRLSQEQKDFLFSFLY